MRNQQRRETHPLKIILTVKQPEQIAKMVTGPNYQTLYHHPIRRYHRPILRKELTRRKYYHSNGPRVVVIPYIGIPIQMRSIKSSILFWEQKQ